MPQNVPPLPMLNKDPMPRISPSASVIQPMNSTETWVAMEALSRITSPPMINRMPKMTSQPLRLRSSTISLMAGNIGQRRRGAGVTR